MSWRDPGGTTSGIASDVRPSAVPPPLVRRKPGVFRPGFLGMSPRMPISGEETVCETEMKIINRTLRKAKVVLDYVHTSVYLQLLKLTKSDMTGLISRMLRKREGSMATQVDNCSRTFGFHACTRL